MTADSTTNHSPHQLVSTYRITPPVAIFLKTILELQKQPGVISTL